MCRFRTGSRSSPRRGRGRCPWLDERARWERVLASVTPQDVALGKSRWQVSRRIVAAFHRAGVPILTGTDATMPRIYPGSSLYEEIALLVESGLTPIEALRSATLEPAKFLGIATTTGSVAVGKRAESCSKTSPARRHHDRSLRGAACTAGSTSPGVSAST